MSVIHRPRLLRVTTCVNIDTGKLPHIQKCFQTEQFEGTGVTVRELPTGELPRELPPFDGCFVGSYSHLEWKRRGLADGSYSGVTSHFVCFHMNVRLVHRFSCVAEKKPNKQQQDLTLNLNLSPFCCMFL